MNEEQERILYHLLDKIREAEMTACTPEEIEGVMRRVVAYVHALVDGTHILSEN